jgi:hypothetical protein
MQGRASLNCSMDMCLGSGIRDSLHRVDAQLDEL